MKSETNTRKNQEPNNTERKGVLFYIGYIVTASVIIYLGIAVVKFFD